MAFVTNLHFSLNFSQRDIILAYASSLCVNFGAIHFRYLCFISFVQVVQPTALLVRFTMH